MGCQYYAIDADNHANPAVTGIGQQNLMLDAGAFVEIAVTGTAQHPWRLLGDRRQADLGGAVHLDELLPPLSGCIEPSR